jgi:predicted ATP-dependent endonuclease of OLD family
VGVNELIKLADQLGINWLIAADNDQQGQNDIRTANGHLGSRPRQRHIHMLQHGDMEVYLCMEGFGAFFEQNVSQQKKGTITAQKGTLEYWKQVVDAQQRSSKPRNAFAVITEVDKKGKKAIPQQIQNILNTALELAKEAT